MRKFWDSAKRWLPGTLISLALLLILSHFINLGEVWSALKKANLTYVLVALAGSVTWLVVRAQVWRSLLRSRPDYGSVFACLCEGYLMNNFLPFRLGEVGKAFLLSRKSRMGFMEVVPTVVIERLVDIIFSAGLLVLSVPLVMGYSGAARVGYIVGSLMLVGLVGLYLLARYRDQAQGLFERLSLRSPRLQSLGGRWLRSFFEGLSALTDLRLFGAFLAWMLLDWLIAIGQYTILLKAFFPQATLVWGVFILGASALGGAIPSLPGGLGTLDATLTGAVVLLGKNVDTAAGFVVAIRLFNYLVTGIPALIALGREGQTLKGVYQDVMKVRNQTSGTESK